MTATKLARLFRYYNRRYFAGQLPVYRIRFGRLPGHRLMATFGRWGMGFHDRRTRTLWFDPLRIRGDRMWRIILMHEMSHILARRGHGATFFEQLCRCPDYVLLYECGGDRELAAWVKHGRDCRAD